MSRQIHMFEGMQRVKVEYTESNLSDTEYAAHLTELLNRKYSVAQVRQYRKSLGIENNRPRAESKLAMAVSLLREAVHVVLDDEVKKKVKVFLESVE